MHAIVFLHFVFFPRIFSDVFRPWCRFECYYILKCFMTKLLWETCTTIFAVRREWMTQRLGLWHRKCLHFYAGHRSCPRMWIAWCNSPREPCLSSSVSPRWPLSWPMSEWSVAAEIQSTYLFAALKKNISCFGSQIWRCVRERRLTF